MHATLRFQSINSLKAMKSWQLSTRRTLRVLQRSMSWRHRLFYINRQIIMDRAAALRQPTIYGSPEMAEQGGFAAYGPRLLQLFEEVLARQLVQLFRGTKVADIPVEHPTKFELVINLKTAKAMGVTVPAALLARADKIIE